MSRYAMSRYAHGLRIVTCLMGTLLTGLAPVAAWAAGPVAKPTPAQVDRTKPPTGPELETPVIAPVSKAPVASVQNGVLTFDPLTIEGRVQKPQAIYNLGRSNPSFGELAPEESFVPKILRSVDGEPF